MSQLPKKSHCALRATAQLSPCCSESTGEMTTDLEKNGDKKRVWKFTWKGFQPVVCASQESKTSVTIHGSHYVLETAAQPRMTSVCKGCTRNKHQHMLCGEVGNSAWSQSVQAFDTQKANTPQL